MQVACIGRGNVGGGLGDLWERAGHQVTRFGHDGGDVSAAEAVLLAVPGDAVAEALGKVRGLEGKIVIDATNRYGTKPPVGYASNAEYVKSRTNGPTAKSFNLNIARLFGRLAEARATPCNLWCGDEEAREAVERLNRDAGFEPVYEGSLENAATQEAFAGIIRGIAQGGMGPFVYRMAPPDQL
jgi:predicted dinucleotide-binding enzyme